MSLRRNIIAGWCPSLGPTAGAMLDRFAGRNHGSLTNMDPSTDWVADGGKWALDFDGSNDQVRIAPISLGTTHTVVAWLRPVGQTNSFNFGPVLGTSNSNIAPLSVTGLTANGLTYSMASGGVSASVAAMANLTSFVGSVRIETGVTLYQNGIAVGSGTLPGNDAASPDRIAFRASHFFYRGLLYEITCFSRALSASEIRNLYLLGRCGIYQQQRRTRYASVRRFRRRQYAQLVGGGLV